MFLIKDLFMISPTLILDICQERNSEEPSLQHALLVEYYLPMLQLAQNKRMTHGTLALISDPSPQWFPRKSSISLKELLLKLITNPIEIKLGKKIRRIAHGTDSSSLTMLITLFIATHMSRLTERTFTTLLMAITQDLQITSDTTSTSDIEASTKIQLVIGEVFL